MQRRNPQIARIGAARISARISEIARDALREKARLESVEGRVLDQTAAASERIHPGREQERRSGQRIPSIARRSQHIDAQAPTRRVTRNRDLLGRQPLREQPAVHRQTVVVRAGESMFRRQAVLGSEHLRTGPQREPCDQLAIAVDGSDHVSTAVQVQQGAPRCRVFRSTPLAGNPVGVDGCELDAPEEWERRARRCQLLQVAQPREAPPLRADEGRANGDLDELCGNAPAGTAGAKREPAKHREHGAHEEQADEEKCSHWRPHDSRGSSGTRSEGRVWWASCALPHARGIAREIAREIHGRDQALDRGVRPIAPLR